MTYKLMKEADFLGGTSLQGFVNDSTLSELTAILGKPQYHPDYNPHPCDEKIKVEWIFSYGGKMMTLYCWKWYKTPEKNDRITWNLGGYKHDYNERQAFLAWIEREVKVKRTLAKEGIEDYPLGI